MLEQLCEQANKSTGISQPKDFERFCKFVVMAHEEKVSLPENALGKHFEEHGWACEQAEAAAKRFAAAGFLLRMYDQFRAGELEL